MQFAVSLPFWQLFLIAAAALLAAWTSYAGPRVPLDPSRRAALRTVRALTLLLIVICLLRPVRVVPPDSATDAVVPILVDTSRSMSLRDVDGRPRVASAAAVLAQLQPALQQRFHAEVWTFGDRLQRLESRPLSATDRQSDLSGALRAMRERYRDRRIAGVVVLSDGGDTGSEEAAAVVADGQPSVYTVGFGAPLIESDFEVLDVAAGEVTLAESSVDLTVAAVARGTTSPFDIRLLENDRPIDVRRVTPASNGRAASVVFTVSPPRDTAAVYTVDIPSAPGESVPENNRRSVLVESPGQPRPILMIEGAPGFEHAFIKRALMTDPGIELDSVVRKGRDARGDATYFVQAAPRRAPRLATGFPQEKAALYAYDAVILANVERDAMSRAQLQMLSEFVDVRGGGLLLLGARSFAQQAYAGTPLDEVLPLQLTGRGAGVTRVSASAPHGVQLTASGLAHPVMRIAATEEDVRKGWGALPALTGISALGALRPGAEALALVGSPDGTRPLIAVQRFGRGRSMVFTGEASWRWRMQMPSTDRTYEMFWRQAARWIAAGAPPPVIAMVQPSHGGRASVNVDVRTSEFEPVADAEVSLRVTRPDGQVVDATAPVHNAQSGRYAAELQLDAPGIYRVTASGSRAGESLGSHERAVLVGGADLEMADPRLNEDVLKRVAEASGGAYVRPAEATGIPELLAAASVPAAPRLEELWHTGWMMLAIVLLLAAEWGLRRQWGLR